ncbi:DUF6364 family protein [Membranihabitans maritimus]|uniref:DUF6364 family protein n=1 Tax=Membranihabitans maritimus TaxID=2904244 RepID=UPI001F30CEAD|nr:DUF6364 family protein [Membranihabitans maritimus]
MDAKITLSFNKEVIAEAKRYAKEQNISLSRLTEYLYRNIVRGQYRNLEEFPISEWVQQVAEGKAEYKANPPHRKDLKDEFLKNQK